MKRVAKHLRERALAIDDGDEADLFARSAFNRYYYSAYLIVRSGIQGLDPKWSGNVAHAQIPDMLRGQINSELRKHKNAAVKINDKDLVKALDLSVNAAKSLAEMMEKGRYARVSADYNPEIKVIFSGVDGFSLNEVPVDQAKAWPEKAEIWMTQILAAWSQVHD